MCLDARLPVGTPILEYCAALEDQAGIAEILSIVERHEMLGANKAEWILDAETVLKKMSDARVPMAIVTRNMRSAAELTVKRLNIPIEIVITRDDCAPKPAPDGLIMAANQLSIAPANLIYVGDYKFDIDAARNAGMTSCLLANQRNSHFADNADKVIDCFQQLEDLFKL